MALTNYTDLLASMASWADRTDLTSIMPDLVVLAEERINRELRVRKMVVNTTIPTVANTQYVTLPSDWLEIESIFLLVAPPNNLQVITSEQMGARFPAGYYTGTPKFFAVIGEVLQLGPTPDGVYSVSMDYYKRFTALATTPTNWLLTQNPSVYLSAAMVELAIFLRDADQIALWDAKFRAAIAALETSDEMSLRSGSTIRVRAL